MAFENGEDTPFVFGKDELEFDTTPLWFKKAVNANLSLEAKRAFAENSTLKKQFSLDGYQEVDLHLVDGDSGYAYDNNGNKIDVRISSPLQNVDAVDTQDNIFKSTYKMKIQPDFVAKLYGVDDPSQLTPEQYENAKYYHQQEVVKSFDKDYQFEPFDPNKKYEKTDGSVKAYIRTVGKDKYGRNLIEAINPNTKREVSWDVANNPYLNAAFDVYNTLDTAANRKKLKEYEQGLKLQNIPIEELLDNDGELGELYDQVKSAALQSLASFMNAGFIKDNFNTDQDYWSALASEEVGQAIADRIAGVKTSTRRDYANEMLKAEKLWEQGHYLDSIFQYSTQVDRMLADSSVQMTEVLVGTAYTYATGGMLGLGVLAAKYGSSAVKVYNIASKVIGAGLIAGTEQTLRDAEKFKVNNGREMTGKEYGAAWVLNTLALAPDAFIAGTNIKRFLPKPLSKLLTGVQESKYQAAAGFKDYAKTVLESALFEFFQEPTQNAVSEANAGNVDSGSYLERFEEQFQGENLKQRRQEAIMGALSAGALSGTVGISSIFKSKKAKVDADNQNKYDEAVSTPSNQEVENTVLSNIQDKVVPLINKKADSLEELGTALDTVNENNVEGISKKTASDLAKCSYQLIYDYANKVSKTGNNDKIEDFKNFLKDRNINIEELTAQAVLYSGEYEVLDKADNKGKEYTEQYKEKLKEKSDEFIDFLVNNHFITRKAVNAITSAIEVKAGDFDIKNGKTSLDVAKEVLLGKSGQFTYVDNYRKAQEALNNAKTDADKALATAQLDKAYDNIMRLANNQAAKVQSKASIAASMVNDKNINEGTIPNAEKGFTFTRKQLARYNEDSKQGAALHQFFTETVAPLRELRKLLDKNKDKEKIKEIDNILKITEQNEKSFKDSVKQLQNQNALKNATKEEVNKAFKRIEAKEQGSLLEDVKPTNTDNISTDSSSDNSSVVSTAESTNNISTDSSTDTTAVSAGKEDTSNKGSRINSKARKEEIQGNTKGSAEQSLTEAPTASNQETNKPEAEVLTGKTISAITNIVSRAIKKYGKDTDNRNDYLINNLKKYSDELLKQYIDKKLGKTEYKNIIEEILNQRNIAKDTSLDSIIEDFRNKHKEFKKLINSDKGKKFYSLDVAEDLNAIKELGIFGNDIKNRIKELGIFTKDNLNKNDNFKKAYEGYKLAYKDTVKVINELRKKYIIAQTKQNKLASDVSNAESKPVFDKLGRQVSEQTRVLAQNIQNKFTSKYKEQVNEELESSKTEPSDTRIEELERSYEGETVEDTNVSENNTTDGEVSNSLVTSDEQLELDINNKTEKESNPINEQLNSSKQFINSIIEHYRNKNKKLNNGEDPFIVADSVTAVVNRAASTLLTTDTNSAIFKDWLKEVEIVFNSIKFAINYRVGKQDRTFSHAGAFIRSSAFQLLYNGTKELVGKNKLAKFNLEFNPRVLTAIDLAVKDFLANTNIDDFTGYSSNSTIASMFGLNESNIKGSDIAALRSITKSNGTIRSNLANILGKAIGNNLGLVLKENGELHALNGVESALGVIALQYMEARGYIKQSSFTVDGNTARITNFDEGVKIPTVIFNKNFIYSSNIREQYKILEANFVKDSSFREEPRFNAPRKFGKAYEFIRHSKLMRIPTYMSKLMKQLARTPYEVDNDFVNIIKNAGVDLSKLDNKEALFAHPLIKSLLRQSGWLDVNSKEFSHLPKDLKNTQEGKNLSIETELLGLLKAVSYNVNAEQSNGRGKILFFDRFMSKNNRIFIDGNDINPSANKTLQRFLILPKKLKTIFNPNNSRHTELEAYALAQAFNVLGKEKGVRELGEAFNNLIKNEDGSYNVAKAEDMLNTFLLEGIEGFNNKFNVGQKLDVENLGQCINVLQHLVNKAKANGKSFTTNLAVENDSTTSGYFIKLLQCPDLSLKEFFLKVGIQSGNVLNSMHQLKKTNGFLDIYKTTAVALTKRLEALPEGSFFNKEFYRVFRNANKRIFEDLVNTIRPAFPVATKNADGSYNVSSTLRTMLKLPTMVFGYGGGLGTLSRSVVDDMYARAMQLYADNTRGILKESELSKEEKALLAFTEKLNKLSKDGLRKHIFDKSGSEIYVTTEGYKASVEQVFYDIIANTYGNQVAETLNEMYAPLVKFNKVTFGVSKCMYTMFSMAFKEKLNKLEKEGKLLNKENIKVSQLVDILRELQTEGLMPGIPSYFKADPNTLLDSVGLLEVMKSSMNDPNALLAPRPRETKRGETMPGYVHSSGFTLDTEGNLSPANTINTITDFSEKDTLAAIIPIHALDGAAMALTQSKFMNTTSIFDAMVMSALDSDSTTHEYNRNNFLVGKEYSMLEEYSDKLDDMYESFKENYANLVEDFNDRIGIKGFTKKELDFNTFSKMLDVYTSNIMLQRKNFFNESYFITNMDGDISSGFKYHSDINLEDTVTKQDAKTAKDVLGSSEGYLDLINKQGEVIADANTGVEGRKNLIDYMQDLAKATHTKVMSNEYVKHIKSLFDKINPEKLVGYHVLLTEGNQQIGAAFNDFNKPVIVQKYNNSSIAQAIRKLIEPNSLAETYAHEVLHKVTHYAIEHADELGLQGKLNRIQKIMESAIDKKIITPELFMPDNYDPKYETEVKEAAERAFNYFTSNKNKPASIIHEFVAYAGSNEKVMKALSEHTFNEDRKNETYFEKFSNFIKDILDVVFGNTRLSDFSKRKQLTMAQEMEQLIVDLSMANSHAKTGLQRVALKGVVGMRNTLGKVVEYGDKFMKPRLNNAIYFMDNKGWFIDPKARTVVGRAIKLAGIVGTTPFNHIHRDVVMKYLKYGLKANSTGLLVSTLNELSVKDRATNQLSNLNALTRNIDSMAKDLEKIVHLDLLDAFGKDSLSVHETTALTKLALMTDLQSLQSMYTAEDIINTVIDSNYRTEQIQTLIKQLELSKEDKTYITNQAKALAHYMVTGTAPINTKTSASGILNNLVKADYLEEYTKIVDNLASMYAVELAVKNNDHLVEAFKGLSSKGINEYLKAHTDFIKNYAKNDNVVYTKGMYKTVYDVPHEFMTESASKEQDMRRAGYALVYKYDSPYTRNSKALYRRVVSTPTRRDGSSWVIKGVLDIKDSLMKDILDINKKNSDETEIMSIKKSMQLAIKNASELTNKMRTKEYSLDEIAKISGTDIGVYNSDNRLTNVKYSIPTAIKENTLGMNMDGLSVLSKMQAQNSINLNATEQNLAVFQFLMNDMQMNMTEGHYLRNNISVKYVKISKAAKDSYIRKAYDTLPAFIKEQIEDGTIDFRVRDDWLMNVFGVETISVVNSKLARKQPVPVQKFLQLSENTIKTLTTMAKKQIVLKMPKVVIGNIVSNFMYSVSQGHNPIDILRTQVQSIADVRDYMQIQKEYNRVVFKTKIGTATKEETNKIERLKDRLKRNPVHPLIKKGMYQSIVEDVRLTDMENTTGIANTFMNSKIVKAIPDKIKTPFKYLYGTSDTAIYQFLNTTTQYSDFIARVTEYKLSMRNAPKQYINEEINPAYTAYEAKVVSKVWDAFINYDLPSSAIEQYANDMGLVMFTKYFKRIQQVIFKGIMDSPTKALMFLLGQHYIMNTDDIYEQNLLQKNYRYIFHNPIENAATAILPMPLQFMLDMKKAF